MIHEKRAGLKITIRGQFIGWPDVKLKAGSLCTSECLNSRDYLEIIEDVS